VKKPKLCVGKASLHRIGIRALGIDGWRACHVDMHVIMRHWQTGSENLEDQMLRRLFQGLCGLPRVTTGLEMISRYDARVSLETHVICNVRSMVRRTWRTMRTRFQESIFKGCVDYQKSLGDSTAWR
jgi:hypothetical protein